jgi:hypothetical protein
LDNFIEEMQSRQRNIDWPDRIRNAWRVDEFLWKGVARPIPVQHIGAWMFGIVFLGWEPSY